MNPSSMEIAATILFALALVHTFSVSLFQRLAERFKEGTPGENFFHLLGEVEVVFGLWAGFFVALIWAFVGKSAAIRYIESANFTEPLFVFVIMTVASTRPILQLSESAIHAVSRALPLPPSVAFFATAMVVGPLLGSVITEPAAMTVTALLLKKRYFDRAGSASFLYSALAVLFVNVSIGGVLTPFAAPPVLMVAAKWDWDLSFMLSHFGWKAVIGVILNAALATTYFFTQIRDLGELKDEKTARAVPYWVSVIHLLFLAAIVTCSHHPTVFAGIFLFFLGVVTITGEYHDELKLREALLVGFFLAGLVVLGGPQRWWIEPLITRFGPGSLFAGATILTGFVDNAALTYLGSQVPELSSVLKYALVAGAVAGGGLTVIANAPNPAGYSILQGSFRGGVNPLRLFAYALIPTLIAMGVLWLP